MNMGKIQMSGFLRSAAWYKITSTMRNFTFP